jgi:glutathione S-transferase
MSDARAIAPFKDDSGFKEIVRAYAIHQDNIATAPARLIAILAGLATQLHRQHASGSDYFVGDRLSATDLHWACLSQMVAPLPPEDCPMPEWMRENYRRNPPDVIAAIDPILIEHRNRIFRNHIGLPLVF